MYKLRSRQVHLDFHTSGAIEGIGANFDRRQWQQALKAGHVDSITCFSKCHHGWSYHPTKVGKAHPHLACNLLGEQFAAAKEIDVNVPVYLSAGLDNVASEEHPEWRAMGVDGRYIGVATITDSGFHRMCFGSPYLDYLCAQIREAVEMFPTCDGIFLDIVSQHECCCKWCLDWMHRHGLNPGQQEHRQQCADAALEKYYKATNAAARSLRADMPVFHNSGHIQRGRRDIIAYNSHLELESLPTGGWGYDHFPVSARYCQNLPYDFLGMTGKFHTTWGEFGGYKHPNALKYECAAMVANGAKCSVGDQLHPSGAMDATTYAIIGAAYAEVEAKEPWCREVQSVADIGLLSSASLKPGHGRDDSADVGAGRILLEAQLLFDVLDAEMDFGKYRMLIVPDDVAIDPALRGKIDAYLAAGGKLMLTGSSGVNPAGNGLLFDVGASYHGVSEFQPDFILPVSELRPSFLAGENPFVMYLPSQRIKATDGRSLGAVHDPYFNRTYRHFCSHQHAPARPEASGFDCGVIKGNIMHLAHPVFSIYRGYGAVIYREYIVAAIKMLLGRPTVTTNMPSSGRVVLTDQKQNGRMVLHLLHAHTMRRGGPLEQLSGGSISMKPKGFEIIEDLLPLHDVRVSVAPGRKITKATLEPQGKAIEFTAEGDVVNLKLPELICHQMVALHYQK